MPYDFYNYKCGFCDVIFYAAKKRGKVAYNSFCVISSLETCMCQVAAESNASLKKKGVENISVVWQLTVKSLVN